MRYQLLFTPVVLLLTLGFFPTRAYARPALIWYTDDFLQDSDGPDGMELYEKLSLDTSQNGITRSRVLVFGISNNQPINGVRGVQTEMALGMLSNWMRPGLKIAVPAANAPIGGSCGSLQYASYGLRLNSLFPNSIRDSNLLSWSAAWDYFIQQVISQNAIPIIYNSGQSGELAAKLETNPSYYYGLIRDQGGIIVGALAGGTNGCDGGGGLIARRAQEFGVIQGGGTLTPEMFNGRSFPDHKLGSFNYEARRGNHGDDPTNPWSWAIDSHFSNSANELIEVLENTGIPSDVHYINLRGDPRLKVGFRWYNPRDSNPQTSFAATSLTAPNNVRSSSNSAFYLEPHPSQFDRQIFLQSYLEAERQPTLHESLGKNLMTSYASFDFNSIGVNPDARPYDVSSSSDYSIQRSPLPSNSYNRNDQVLAIDDDAFITQARPFTNQVGGTAYTSILQSVCGISDSSGPELIIGPDNRQHISAQTTRIRIQPADISGQPNAMRIAVYQGTSLQIREISPSFQISRNLASNQYTYDVSASVNGRVVAVRINGVVRYTFNLNIQNLDPFYINFGATVTPNCKAQAGNAIMFKFLFAQPNNRTASIEKISPYRTTIVFARPSDIWTSLLDNSFTLEWNGTRLSLLQALPQIFSASEWSADGSSELLAITFNDRIPGGGLLFPSNQVFSIYTGNQLQDLEYFP